MSASPTAGLLSATLVLSLGVGAIAQAREPNRIYSYDAVSETAQTLAPGGLTFVFRKSPLGGTRVLKVLSTQEKGTAELKPASDRDLGPGGLNGAVGHRVREHDLYEILPGGQGGPLINAACPGAQRAWLAFGDLRRPGNLVIHAIGLKAGGKARLCASMEFAWHGEWKLPPS
jgi:hypothetical protein